MVIWIVGLSASGKSTLAELVCQHLRSKGRSAVLLDGDVMRDIFDNDVGHDIDGRAINARRLSYLSRNLGLQGVDVVAAVLSIFPEWQLWNRENIPDYRQIWLDVDLDVLVERETKGIYKRALSGELTNVVGVDIPFPEPVCSDLKIPNNEFNEDLTDLMDVVAQRLKI